MELGVRVGVRVCDIAHKSYTESPVPTAYEMIMMATKCNFAHILTIDAYTMTCSPSMPL
jgi:hypothetical protein